MGRLCDFLFFGAGILPVMLFLAGEPAFGALSSVCLCIAAGVCGIGDPQSPYRNRPVLRRGAATRGRPAG